MGWSKIEGILFMKRILSIFLCLALILGFVPGETAYAAVEWPSDISISADGGILMDINSGAVLFEKNSHEPYYPASITKILTALIVIENCGLDETVTFSNTAVNTLEPNSSILGARTGDTLSVRECLYALLLQSANEVANALAEHCAGSMDAFAEMMNEKAAELGCTDSHFANPSGLNDPDHYVSAYDMALIAKAAFSNPTFVEVDSTTYYDVPAGKLKQYPDGWRYYAHHRMLRRNDSLYYEGVIGGKTGYTSLAGNTLVTCAERDGMKLVAVVLNGHQTHYSDTKALFDYGFKNFKSVPVADQDSTYSKVADDLTISGIFSGSATRLTVNKNSTVTLPADGSFSDVTSTLDYDLTDDVPDGAIARIDYQYGDKLVGQAYLEASVTQGYVPGAVKQNADTSETGAAAEITAGNPETENIAAESTAADISGTDAAAETSSARNSGKSANQADSSDKKTGSSKTSWLASPAFGIIKKVLTVIAVIGIIGGAVFGIMIYQENKAQNERVLRHQRREKRLKEWGYSTTEFDMIMEEHLRSKSGIKKPGFWERMRERFRRR